MAGSAVFAPKKNAAGSSSNSTNKSGNSGGSGSSVAKIQCLQKRALKSQNFSTEDCAKFKNYECSSLEYSPTKADAASIGNHCFEAQDQSSCIVLDQMISSTLHLKNTEPAELFAVGAEYNTIEYRCRLKVGEVVTESVRSEKLEASLEGAKANCEKIFSSEFNREFNSEAEAL